MIAGWDVRYISKESGFVHETVSNENIQNYLKSLDKDSVFLESVKVFPNLTGNSEEDRKLIIDKIGNLTSLVENMKNGLLIEV